MTDRRTTRRTDRRHAEPEREPVAELFDRAPPHSLEAERGVIASMLMDSRCIDEVVLITKAEHFFAPSHRKIFAEIKAIHDDPKKSVDVELLVERLKASGELDLIGGLAGLLDIAESVPTAANATHYAEVVADKCALRELLHASTDTIRDVYGLAGEEHDDVKHIVERAEQRVFGVADTGSEQHTADMSTALAAWMLDFDTRKEGVAKGIPTNYEQIDKRVGGLRGKELTIVAARPSMGKTAFAMNVARNLAELRGKHVAFVSLEMSRIELVERLLACIANVSLTRLRNNWINPTERRCIIEASSDMSKFPLYIDDAPGRSVSQIAAVCRRLKRKAGLDALFIDYLQLLDPENPKDPREQQVSKMARGLKKLARELDIPVVCLSQLNREAEKSGDNRPQLSNLRESGAIEQDADNVVFVHRPAYYLPEGDLRDKVKLEAEIIWRKVRNGEVGTDKLTWRGEFQRFEDYVDPSLPT